jgi:hypothetical protein
MTELDPNESDAATLWAEIHRLRAAAQGPDGYATWQEAATAERVRRARAEALFANTRSTRQVMPIMGATLLKEMPFAMLVPHEAQALSNHGGQTLDRLAQRGGLGASEAVDILQGARWGAHRPCIENELWLVERINQWRIDTQTPV